MSEREWKQGTVLDVAETEGGRTRLCFKRSDTKKAKAEGKTPFFFLVLVPDHIGTYKKGDGFKSGDFIKGTSILGPTGKPVDTFFENYTEMKGDTHLVPGEHKASDDFCEKAPTVLDKGMEVPLTIEIRVKFICAAAIATQGKSDHFEAWYDKMVSKLNETNN